MSGKSDLPPGWERVRFGDIAEHIADRVDDPTAAGVDRYVGLEHIDPDLRRVTRWGAPTDVSAQKLRFQAGDIIFGKRRAYQRKVAIADFDGICSAHAMVLRERPGMLAPGFLIHFMGSDVFMKRAIKISVGSLSPTINWSTLRVQEFVLPPIDKQAKLEVVSTAAASLALHLQSVEGECGTLKASIADCLLDVYGGSLRPLGDALQTSIRRRGLNSTEQYRWGGVLSFGRGMLDRGLIAGSKSKYQYIHELKSGDVVFSKLKAWEGAVAIVPVELDGAVVSPEFPTFSVDARVALPEYLAVVFTARWFWQLVRSASKGTVERRTRIYPQQFLQLAVPLPTIAAQADIVRRFTAVTATSAAALTRVEDTRRILNALMNDSVSTGQQ
jgi:restriction endonuclease S subunit